MGDTKSKPKTEHERQVAKIEKLIASGAIPAATGKATIDALIASKAAPQVRTPEKARTIGVPAALIDAVVASIKAVNDWVGSNSTVEVDGKKEPTHRARWFFNTKGEDSGKDSDTPAADAAPADAAPEGEPATVPAAADAAPAADPAPAAPEKGKGKGKGKNPTV